MASTRSANVDVLFSTLQNTNPAAFNVLTKRESTVGLGARIFGNPLITKTGSGSSVNDANFSKVLADIDSRLSSLLSLKSGDAVTNLATPAASNASNSDRDLINLLRSKGINISGTPASVAKALQEKPSEILEALGLNNFGVGSDATPASTPTLTVAQDRAPDISTLLSQSFGGALIPQTAFTDTTFGIGSSLVNPFLKSANDTESTFSPTGVFDMVSAIQSKLGI